ncbi:MAG: type II secretion system protein GspN [Desulfobacca sp.]|nr:type II secretion system protein GspN [Desulfobacca sp.]
MKSRHWLYWVPGTAGAVFLTFFLTLFFISDHELYALFSRILEQQGYSLRAARFNKVFPLGVQAIDLEISGPKGVLLKAKEAEVHLKPLPLLFGKVSLTGQVVMGAGHIEGSFLPRTGESHIDAREVHLEDIPFFQNITGAQVKGKMNLNGRFKWKGKESEGALRLEIKGASVTGVKIGNIPLPDADHSLVQIQVQEEGGIVGLKSCTLQSKGLYVRLQGEAPLISPFSNAPLKLTLELMPKPEFLEKQKFIFHLLAKYLIAPGYYLIPIRGTLENPSLI